MRALLPAASASSHWLRNTDFSLKREPEGKTPKGSHEGRQRLRGCAASSRTLQTNQEPGCRGKGALVGESGAEHAGLSPSSQPGSSISSAVNWGYCCPSHLQSTYTQSTCTSISSLVAMLGAGGISTLQVKRSRLLLTGKHCHLQDRRPGLPLAR